MKNKKRNMYDVIIIGGGPAGITAGIYVARKRLKAVLITKDFLGQAGFTGRIENWPGEKRVQGPELMRKFEEHLKEYEIDIREEEVVSVNKNESFSVKTKESNFEAKCVIFASGRKPKPLGITGEEEFVGKGVAYCTTCDAPFFKDKKVMVVGGGNAGFESAIELTDYAKEVFLYEFASDFSADEFLQEQAKEKGIELRTGVELKEIKGGDFVEKVRYKDKKNENEEEIDVDGVFVEIGSLPVTSPVESLVDTNSQGDVEINPHNNMTKTEGLFAAGDVTTIMGKQIVIAAGEGAKTALAAYKYIKNNY